MFKFKQRITGKTGAGGRKIFKAIVPLKYLSLFWRALAMQLTNCEINLILTWSSNWVLSDNVNQEATFETADTKPYVPVKTLSSQESAKLLQQLKSCFKRTVNWNKYQSKVLAERQSEYLD